MPAPTSSSPPSRSHSSPTLRPSEPEHGETSPLPEDLEDESPEERIKQLKEHEEEERAQRARSTSSASSSSEEKEIVVDWDGPDDRGNPKKCGPSEVCCCSCAYTHSFLCLRTFMAFCFNILCVLVPGRTSLRQVVLHLKRLSYHLAHLLSQVS